MIYCYCCRRRRRILFSITACDLLYNIIVVGDRIISIHFYILFDGRSNRKNNYGFPNCYCNVIHNNTYYAYHMDSNYIMISLYPEESHNEQNI